MSSEKIFDLTAGVYFHFCNICGGIFFFSHIYVPASGQAVVTGVVPPPPRSLPSIFIAHRVQKSHCSSIFHQVLQTHALALPARQCVRKKNSPRMFTTMHSAGFEIDEADTYRLEDNLLRHRDDPLHIHTCHCQAQLFTGGCTVYCATIIGHVLSDCMQTCT